MNKRSKSVGFYYEKFRAFLLVFLLILCIVQVGILWSSQSGSFPFLSSFFPDSKTTSQASLEKIKLSYMLPYRVVISKGYDDNHFIVPNGSNEYFSLWDGASEYLYEALETKPTKIEAFSEESWGTIVSNNPYYFEFKTQMPVEIVKWVCDIKKPVEGIAGFSKAVINPDDPNNSYLDTLYLRDDYKIYTYVLSDYKGNSLRQEEFDSVYNSLDSNPNTRNYKIAIETGKKLILPKDMIAPLSGNSEEKYANITLTPFAGVNGHISSVEDYNAIQMEMFGEVRSDYVPDEDVYGSVVFKNSDSVYRLYKSSIIEYKYTEKQSISERTTLLEAYRKAAGYLMEMSARSKFMSGINLYLSSVKEENNSYIFKFDYSISQGGGYGDVPILLKEFKLPNSQNPIDSAISIEANSKRVLQCRIVALKLKVDKNYEDYKWNFPECLDRAYYSINELGKSNLPINDYGIYYVLSYPELNNQTINPSFVLFNEEGSYHIPLKETN